MTASATFLEGFWCDIGVDLATAETAKSLSASMVSGESLCHVPGSSEVSWLAIFIVVDGCKELYLARVTETHVTDGQTVPSMAFGTSSCLFKELAMFLSDVDSCLHHDGTEDDSIVFAVEWIRFLAILRE